MGWCADFVLGETGALQFLLHWRPAELALTPSASCNHIPGMSGWSLMLGPLVYVQLCCLIGCVQEIRIHIRSSVGPATGWQDMCSTLHLSTAPMCSADVIALLLLET